jgi:cytidyltransferase-like protein
MKKVFVSGCYDIVHGGHIQFFKDAKKYGDILIVNIASDEVIKLTKNKRPSLPIEHRVSIIDALEIVDKVCVSSDVDTVLDFKTNLINEKPDFLISSDDDENENQKRDFCESVGVKYININKTEPFQKDNQISTSKIINLVKRPKHIPLRVDFAGGWLDVPALSRIGAFIVNCTINKFMDEDCEFEPGAGVGGSAAWWVYKGQNTLESEINNGVGWQDPAIVIETGLCAWRSGTKPILEMKVNPDFLNNRMALSYDKTPHNTPSLREIDRDYDLIEEAGKIAFHAVINKDLSLLDLAIDKSYKVQMGEGMKELKFYGEASKKYCGSGWGGCSLYMFDDYSKVPDHMIKIQPYIRNINE